MIDFYTILTFLVVYLICSINPAIEVCKRKTGEDIRKLGSGNAGTANAMRVLGTPLGTLVIILDELKVFVSFFLMMLITKLFGHEIDTAFKVIFILASIIGHCFPIYYGFRGGKGVIVGITTMAIFDPTNAAICIIAGLVVLLFTKTTSMATLAGSILYVIISFVHGYDYIWAVIIAEAIVMFKHRGSIYRILTRQEHKFK
ncbi:MAG: glycerol-3-phosphate acyltransferase [Clostridia bacterium]|nr:glycerol-3-phosphate acyltransferase [Clostridia bacterium]